MILSWLCVNIIASVMIPPGYQCAEISCVSIAGGIVTMEKKLEAEKVDREKENQRLSERAKENTANYEAQLAEKYDAQLAEKLHEIKANYETQLEVKLAEKLAEKLANYEAEKENQHWDMDGFGPRPTIQELDFFNIESL